MQHQIIRLAAVVARTGLSKTTIYKEIAEGRFPKPIPLGGAHAVGWLASDVDAAIESWLSAAITEVA